MRKILKDIALVLGIVVSLVTLIGFFSGRLSLPVNPRIRLFRESDETLKACPLCGISSWK